MTDAAFWRGKKVFLTGHTGFKGAWLTLLLRQLGAHVYGYALPPTHQSSLFVAARIADDICQRFADVRDFATLRSAIAEVEPDVVIHMAAQALVRPSYAEPVETFATNVMGTVHVMEAARQCACIKVVLIVTSDKCYENNNGRSTFCEKDRLGGNDPYSNSKACAELVTYSYQKSFFSEQGAARIGTVRAGNVFGGGDWACDRLVPDAMRAFLHGDVLHVRNPNSVRPWQHVLDPVMGYLTLIERLADDERYVGGWNFGPDATSEVRVGTIVGHLTDMWGDGVRSVADEGPHPHEAAYLRLDCTKARTELGWSPRLDLVQGLQLTVDWYRALQRGDDLRQLSLDQLCQVESVVR